MLYFTSSARANHTTRLLQKNKTFDVTFSVLSNAPAFSQKHNVCEASQKTEQTNPVRLATIFRSHCRRSSFGMYSIYICVCVKGMSYIVRQTHFNVQYNTYGFKP